MSCLVCLASDAPLPALPAPRSPSEICITIDTENGTVTAPPEDFWEILPLKNLPLIRSEKRYYAAVEWPRSAPGNAGMLIDYLRCHLAQTDEVELWNLWDGDGAELIRIRRSSVSLKDLTAEQIFALCSADVVHPIRLGPAEAFIQYCLVITR